MNWRKTNRSTTEHASLHWICHVNWNSIDNFSFWISTVIHSISPFTCIIWGLFNFALAYCHFFFISRYKYEMDSFLTRIKKNSDFMLRAKTMYNIWSHQRLKYKKINWKSHWKKNSSYEIGMKTDSKSTKQFMSNT